MSFHWGWSRRGNWGGVGKVSSTWRKRLAQALCAGFLTPHKLGSPDAGVREAPDPAQRPDRRSPIPSRKSRHRKRRGILGDLRSALFGEVGRPAPSASARYAPSAIKPRIHLLERLEERLALNGIPIAKPDLFYAAEVDTALVIGGGNHPLLENDWDPEGSSLTASVVTNPANGDLSNFSSSAGTFTYTPDTSYVGIDTYAYFCKEQAPIGVKFGIFGTVGSGSVRASGVVLRSGPARWNDCGEECRWVSA